MMLSKSLCALALVLSVPVTTLRAADWQPANTHAVIVGVLKWETKGVTSFSERHRKDRELRDTLVKCGVPADQITMLLDEEATLESMRRAVRTAATQAKPGSTLIVYYAGHGGKDSDNHYTFLNYDHDPKQPKKKPAFDLVELTDLIRKQFKGAQVLLLADCCHSGGLSEVARTLSRAGIKAASLTSADACNTSTGNWTFTQTIIDGLNGDPLVDANADGSITLGELANEVADAMKYRENQLYGFATHGVPRDLKLVAVDQAKKPHSPTGGRFALKDYVMAQDGKSRHAARIVDFTDGKYVVEFYDYSDKRRAKLATADLARIAFKTHKVGEAITVLWEGRPYDAKVLKTAGDFQLITYPGWSAAYDEWVLSNRIVEGDTKNNTSVMVEWNGKWYPAHILKTEGEKYYIHYAGYDESWDEWVGKDRIKFPSK